MGRRCGARLTACASRACVGRVGARVARPAGLGKPIGETHDVFDFLRNSPRRSARKFDCDRVGSSRERQHVVVAELPDRQADRMARVVKHDRHAAVDGRRHGARRRDVQRDRHPQRLLHLRQCKPDLGVGPVEHDPQPLARIVEQVERFECELEILQRRDVESRQQRDHVGLVECGQHVVGERGRCVDDDEREFLAQQLQDRRDE